MRKPCFGFSLIFSMFRIDFSCFAVLLGRVVLCPVSLNSQLRVPAIMKHQAKWKHTKKNIFEWCSLTDPSRLIFYAFFPPAIGSLCVYGSAQPMSRILLRPKGTRNAQPWKLSFYGSRSNWTLIVYELISLSCWEQSQRSSAPFPAPCC